MAVITLTTDWGTTDYFVGAMKGDILRGCPSANIVDITHWVKPFDIIVGSFIFRNSWHHFPDGTVHVVGLTGSVNEFSGTIAIKHKNHYFIGSNDGFFSLVFDEKPKEMFYVLSSEGKQVLPGMGVLANSACFLANGGKISDMGEAVTAYEERSLLQPVIEEKVIRGSVIYVDSFGNLVTNVTKELFDRVCKNRPFNILLKSREYYIEEISDYYLEKGRGSLIAHYNIAGHLEISIAGGHASNLLGMNYGEIIRIEFK